MKRMIFLVLLMLTLHAQAQICPVIPTPALYQPEEGTIRLAKVLPVNWGETASEVRDFAATHFSGIYGIGLKEQQQSPVIVFKVDAQLKAEGYTIRCGQNEILVSYADEPGALHAVTSLLQMVETDGEGACIRRALVQDAPRFSWRGLHLDVARHFFSVEEVKRFIDLMALYKFNVLHWHLTDDQGWRIEIKKYPDLTRIGAYRDSTVIGHYSDQPRKYDHIRYGDFYTQDQVKEIVKYAADRSITVVPEIEMPGHSRAALAAYPVFSCTGKQQEVPGLWGIFDDIYCAKDETIHFLQDILEEVISLFPSEYIHVGGDEAPKTRWKECPDCQRIIQEQGFADEHELQSYFIRKMDAFLAAKGRKLIGWDEILEGGLSPNAAVMSWRGEEGGIEAARQHHQVVMTPTTYCYFDYYQSRHSAEPLAIGGYLPLEKVYRFNPVPEGLSAEEAGFILGGQANLWTEYIASMKHLEYMVYPRALALAQSVWCTEKPSYTDFLETFVTVQEPFLQRNKVNYARSVHFPQVKTERTEDGIALSFYEASPDALFDADIAVSNGLHKTSLHRVIGKEDRIFIPRPEEGTESDYSIALYSARVQDTFVFRVAQTHSLGLPVSIEPAPHPKYNHNGSLNLVDGTFGRLPWKGADWLGFNEPDIGITVDLTEVKKMQGVRIGFLDSNGSWIYLPESVEIQTSVDGTRWSEPVMASVSRNTMQDGRQTVYCPGETRFVQLRIHTMERIPEGLDGAGNTPWTFIDEVEILYPDL